MFYLNRCYNRHYNRPIVAPIHIKHVHSSMSYHQATYQKYDRRGHELPSGYGAKEEGGVYKGWNSQLAQWGAIIPTVQRAPGHFEYIYIIMKTNDLCDMISIHIAL